MSENKEKKSNNNPILKAPLPKEIEESLKTQKLIAEKIRKPHEISKETENLIEGAKITQELYDKIVPESFIPLLEKIKEQIKNTEETSEHHKNSFSDISKNIKYKSESENAVFETNRTLNKLVDVNIKSQKSNEQTHQEQLKINEENKKYNNKIIIIAVLTLIVGSFSVIIGIFALLVTIFKK